MIKNYTPVAWGTIIIGVALMIISKSSILDNSQIDNICIGIGAALAVMGIAHLAGKYAINILTPEIREASLREENDERSIRVREKAGWNASRIMLSIFCYLGIASALMNLELYITMLFVTLILLECSLVAGSLVYYEKRM